MSPIELAIDPPAAAIRFAKSAGTLPLSRNTCSLCVGTATRDIDGVNVRIVGVLVTASVQPAASTPMDRAAQRLLRGNLPIDMFNLLKIRYRMSSRAPAAEAHTIAASRGRR